MAKNIIRESFFGERPVITESVNANGEKQFIISGIAGLANTPNGNNNIYPSAILNEAINKFREKKVCKRSVKMLMDHPEYEGKLANTAAVLLEVSNVGEDNYFRYKAQIIDEGQGKILRSIIRAGGNVGVSTRGRGTVAFDQDWPGLPGKYNVINPGFSLENIDFVEEPSVTETELTMQVENKKRSEQMPKTFEELKAEYPEIFKVLEDKHVDAITKLNTLVESLKASNDKYLGQLKSLVESVKIVSPDAFTVLPESQVIADKDAELKRAIEENATLKITIEEAKKNLKVIEDEKAKVEKEKFIESLKVKDPAYFGYTSLVKMFENCATIPEVEKVYNAHKELVENMKNENSNAPSTPKTQTPEIKPSTDLTEAQAKDMQFINDQRLVSGLTPYTKEQYLAKSK